MSYTIYKFRDPDMLLKQDGGYGKRKYKISGPGSISLIKIPAYDKKIIIFGDYHNGYENICYYKNERDDPEKLKAMCNKTDNCIYITDLFDKMCKYHKDKSTPIDFFYEGTIFFENPDLGRDKESIRKVHKRIIDEIPYRTQPFPLLQIRNKFDECALTKENCPPNTRIHSMDTRMNWLFADAEDYIAFLAPKISLFLDHMLDLRTLSEHLVHLPGAIDDMYDYFIGKKLTDIMNDIIHRQGVKIVKQMNKTKKLSTEQNKELSEHIDNIVFDHLEIAKLEKLHIEFIKTIERLKLDKNNRFTQEDYIKRRSNIPFDYYPFNLEHHLSIIEHYFLGLVTSLVELYGLHRMFGVTSDNTRYKKIVVYAGNNHALKMLLILKKLSSAEVVYSTFPDNIVSSTETNKPRRNEAIKRCTVSNISIDEIIKFKF